MKAFVFTAILFALFCNTSFGQDKVIKLNTIKDKEALLNAIYAYTNFTEGKVHFKDNTTVESRLNYNRLNGEVLFINHKNDTLALSSPETTDFIIIGQDAYFYIGDVYVKQLTAYTGINLAQKSKLQYNGTEKKADGYGSYSNAGAVESVNTVQNGVQSKIAIDENQIYTLSDTYYLITPTKGLLWANKKGFLKSFSKHAKDLTDYIATNNTDFVKVDDLEKLLAYAVGLN